MRLVALIAGWVVATAFVLAFALMAEEDANHWDWPHDTGPGFAVTAKYLAVSALLTAVPTALVGWLVWP